MDLDLHGHIAKFPSSKKRVRGSFFFPEDLTNGRIIEISEQFETAGAFDDGRGEAAWIVSADKVQLALEKRPFTNRLEPRACNQVPTNRIAISP